MGSDARRDAHQAVPGVQQVNRRARRCVHRWYDNGGSDFDLGGPMSSPEAFASEYRSDRKEEAEGEAYDEVYKKMRAFAADRGYDLEDGEIESIIEEAEEDGDSVLDCADGVLRELVEDWVADHQE